MKKLLFVVLLAGCATVGLEKPMTFQEKIAYTDATITGVIKTIADKTCKKYAVSGACEEEGRPLHPAVAKGWHEQLSKARAAVKDTSVMAVKGGSCLGEPSTPEACLRLAETMLIEVERSLEKAQKGGM